MPRQAVKLVPLVAVSSTATGLRPERISRAIRHDDLPAYRVGTKTKILVSELERWIASHDPAARGACGRSA